MKRPENQTLVEHIEALRRMLLHCLAALTAAFPAGVALAYPGMRRLLEWICPPELLPVNFHAPFEAFVWRMKFALLVAAVVACPFILWEVWKFVAPALYERERRAVKCWIGWVAFFFALGVVLCLGLVLPFLMRFAASEQSPHLAAMMRLEYVMGLSLWLPFAFGVAFLFPLVALMLVRFGVVRAGTLSHARPYIIVGIVAAAAVLTPPDVVSQVALAVPMWLLFEAALLAARCIEKRTHTAPAADETPAGEPGDYGLGLYPQSEEE